MRFNDRDQLVRLGTLIRTRRLAKQLSQVELATLSHVNKNYIGMLERGEINPTFLTLVSIGRALGMKITI